LITSGADRVLSTQEVDTEAVVKAKTEQDFENLQMGEMEDLLRGEACRTTQDDKLFAMDVATQANIMVTGHDKELKLWRLPGLEQIEWDNE
jgi:predicted nucleic acid-binding protein